jgi:hypothetical protein
MRVRYLIAAVTAAVIPIGAAATAAHADNHPRAHDFFRIGSLTANPDCTLRTPPNPLTAQGLATPYELGSSGLTCSETNRDTAAFVQATIFDPVTSTLTVYNPVVKDADQPLLGAAPTVPVLPPGAVVSIWVGFNGDTLKMTGLGRSAFVNFAQQSYANSIPFFTAVTHAVRRGTLTVPPLGVSPVDGMACPSSRDFSIVDQDQSDNNVEAYPAYGVSNGSDMGTTRYTARALGCGVWTVPNLSVPGSVTTSGQMLEVQAAAYQRAPVALVPGLDPFVVNADGSRNLALQNLYRVMVDQPLTFNGSDTRRYCLNLASVGAQRLKVDAAAEGAVASSNGTGTNLATQLAGRFAASWANLTCDKLTGQPSPITVTTDANGVYTSATYS